MYQLMIYGAETLVLCLPSKVKTWLLVIFSLTDGATNKFTKMTELLLHLLLDNLIYRIPETVNWTKILDVAQNTTKPLPQRGQI